MKFMKLGSKPDTTFQSDGSSTRYVLSELTSDVTIIVEDVKFHLHKFPLLSKSAHLQNLITTKSTPPSSSSSEEEEIHLHNFPGGHTSFEICAKFCYGITVTLNPYNVISVRCAAEYLSMTEDMDRGNLIYKIDIFLNSTIFKSCWKDSIIVLQTTQSLLPLSSEDLIKIVNKCVESIVKKIVIDPERVTWSYTNNRKQLSDDNNNIDRKNLSSSVVPKDWWVEDVCELEIDLYKRVMMMIMTTSSLIITSNAANHHHRKRRIDVDVIGEALRMYAVRWLPDTVEALVSDQLIESNRLLLETVITLIPSSPSSSTEKGVGCGCSCSFMLKLLKASILVDVDESLQEDLIEKISSRLDEASVRDLLLPVKASGRSSDCLTCCDVEMVECMVNRFFNNNKCSSSTWDDDDDDDGGGGAISSDEQQQQQWLRVGKLVDAYLAEVGSDSHLQVVRFVQLAKLIPEVARPCHDGLYGAINIYLKEHPDLSKSEKKKICSLLDVKRLTAEASMHAAQNERLPLRLVVQVLYFEQVRTSSSTGTTNNTASSLDLSNSTTPSAAPEEEEEDEWNNNKPPPASLQNSKSLRKQINKVEKNSESLRKQMEKVKLESEDDDDDDKVEVGLEKNTRRMMRKDIGNNKTRNSRSGIQLLPSRSRRIFDKLWIMGKGTNGESNKSSDTSGSSQSPTTSLLPIDAKSSRRHSIS